MAVAPSVIRRGRLRANKNPPVDERGRGNMEIATVSSGRWTFIAELRCAFCLGRQTMHINETSLDGTCEFS